MESSASCKRTELSTSCKCKESSASCKCMESSASCKCMESSASCKCKESSASCKCKESSAIEEIKSLLWEAGHCRRHSTKIDPLRGLAWSRCKNSRFFAILFWLCGRGQQTKASERASESQRKPARALCVICLIHAAVAIAPVRCCSAKMSKTENPNNQLKQNNKNTTYKELRHKGAPINDMKAVATS